LERARLDAEVTGDHAVTVQSSNVTAFTLAMGPGGCPLDVTRKPTVTIDGQAVTAPSPRRTERGKRTSSRTAQSGRREMPHLKKVCTSAWTAGPVDDAFLDSFIFVRPTGAPMARASLDGSARNRPTRSRNGAANSAAKRRFAMIPRSAMPKSPPAIWCCGATRAAIGSWHGSPGSCRLQWSKDSVTVGGKQWPASSHAPILIYPNPLNPRKYVVLNSGFTFREYDNLNNARQIPKIPDYAVVDTTTPPDERYPARSSQQDFSARSGS